MPIKVASSRRSSPMSCSTALVTVGVSQLTLRVPSDMHDSRNDDAQLSSCQSWLAASAEPSSLTDILLEHFQL